MNILFTVLKSIASVISIYSTICFIRIILTWIPGVRGSKLEYIFSQICDPYLNIFSRIRWLQIGMLDFSPILAFALLSAVSQILLKIANSGKFSFAYILAVLVSFSWEIFASILFLLMILTFIRFILVCMKKPGSPFWNSVDAFIYKISNPLIKPFAKGKFVKAYVYVLIGFLECLIVYAAGKTAVYFLCNLILRIPF